MPASRSTDQGTCPGSSSNLGLGPTYRTITGHWPGQGRARGPGPGRRGQGENRATTSEGRALPFATVVRAFSSRDSPDSTPCYRHSAQHPYPTRCLVSSGATARYPPDARAARPPRSSRPAAHAHRPALRPPAVAQQLGCPRASRTDPIVRSTTVGRGAACRLPTRSARRTDRRGVADDGRRGCRLHVHPVCTHA